MTMLIGQLDRYELKPISAATRTLLCDFAAGDVERPLHQVQADWEEVFQAIGRHGLLGLTHYYLKQWQAHDYPPSEFRRRVEQTCRLNAIRVALLFQCAGKVLVQLAEAGMDYLVVKGPAVAYTVYPHPALRGFNDLDLVVRERDWAAVHRLLVMMGFRLQRGWPEPLPKLVHHDSTYEQVYWHPEMGFAVEVHYDDLLNAGLASRDVEGFWQRARWLDVAGVPIKTLSLEDQLIHLCAHAHFHGYTRLGWFSDLAFIVRDHAAELEWERLLKTVHVEEAQVPTFYSLYFLDRFLGVRAPESVLAALQPDGFRRWWHECYMPEDRILSLSPMARPDFSFYFTPLFKRLLPDLLVMGRRRDKLSYLLRLLAPPRAWLRTYYKLGDTRALWMHYLLHPLRLMASYLAELMVAVLRGHRLGVP